MADGHDAGHTLGLHGLKHGAKLAPVSLGQERVRRHDLLVDAEPFAQDFRGLLGAKIGARNEAQGVLERAAQVVGHENGVVAAAGRERALGVALAEFVFGFAVADEEEPQAARAGASTKKGLCRGEGCRAGARAATGKVNPAAPDRMRAARVGDGLTALPPQTAGSVA